MSKAKSRFQTRHQRRAIPMPAPEVWCVDVYEHEKGWGQRLEDRHTFSSQAQAESFWCQTNAQLALHGDAECFALAHPPYRKKDDC